MGQEGVDPAAQVEHDVVAEDPPGAEQLADHPLDHQVQHGQGRGAAPVVTLGVVGPHLRHPGQDLPALVDESFADLAAWPVSST